MSDRYLHRFQQVKNAPRRGAERVLSATCPCVPKYHLRFGHHHVLVPAYDRWDRALLGAIKSIRIQPSFAGYISKGIALCGKGRVLDARAAFDVASMYTADQDLESVHFLLLIKAIVLFNADQHDEANLLLKELAAGCPNADTRMWHRAYLHVQLGIKALDGACYDEAAVSSSLAGT